jgi:hypothetical protein
VDVVRWRIATFEISEMIEQVAALLPLVPESVRPTVRATDVLMDAADKLEDMRNKMCSVLDHPSMWRRDPDGIATRGNAWTVDDEKLGDNDDT